MNKIGFHGRTVALVALALTSCAHGAASSKSIENGGAAPLEPRCAPLDEYRDATKSLSLFQTFGSREVVLLRPSVDGPKIEQAERELAHPEAASIPRDSSVTELSAGLHAQLDALRRLQRALEARDKAAYLRASKQYLDMRASLSHWQDELPAECRDAMQTLHPRLQPVVIQKVMRAHYSAFRVCYEGGLARNPLLRGEVRIRFVIGLSGRVEKVGPGAVDEAAAHRPLLDPGTESFFEDLGFRARKQLAEQLPPLPDPQVSACIQRAVSALVFPAPDGGIVTVVYPIMLSPG